MTASTADQVAAEIKRLENEYHKFLSDAREMRQRAENLEASAASTAKLIRQKKLKLKALRKEEAWTPKPLI